MPWLVHVSSTYANDIPEIAGLLSTLAPNGMIQLAKGEPGQDCVFQGMGDLEEDEHLIPAGQGYGGTSIYRWRRYVSQQQLDEVRAELIEIFKDIM